MNRRVDKPKRAKIRPDNGEDLYRILIGDYPLLRAEKDKRKPQREFPYAVVDGSQVLGYVLNPEIAEALMAVLWFKRLTRKEVEGSIKKLSTRVGDAFRGSPSY